MINPVEDELNKNSKIIDWNYVDKLLMEHCKGTEIASAIGVCPETLYNRCEDEKGLAFSVYSQQKREHGKTILRSKQWETAMTGDKTMLIWLGKQYMEQRETHDITTAGKELNANKVFQFEIIDTVKNANTDQQEASSVSK